MRVEYVNSMIRTATTPSTGVRKILIEPYGPYLDDGRNTVIEKALADTDNPFDYLLFVDSDISWTPEDVRVIVATAHDYGEPAIFSGAYSSSREGKPFVVAGRTSPDTGNIECFTIPEFQALGATPVRVDGAGAGFLLIPRVVIDTLLEIHGFPSPWFCEPIINGVHLGEDYGFCLRAADAGFPTYLVPSITLLHNKVVALGFPKPATPNTPPV